ncbi:MAG: hypothetical protein AAB893_01800, partial [Patescibacteria group bacterium]
GYSSVLYDTTLAFVYNLLGFNGLTILNVFLWVGIAYLFSRLIKQNILITSLVVFGLFFSSWDVFNLGFRPQIISISLFLLTLLLLSEFRLKDRPLSLLFLPVLFFVWVNIHLGFFLGLIILGLFTLQSYIERKNAALYLVILVNSIGATLLNPFTYKIYSELLRHFQTPLYNLIAEWVRPEWWIQLIIIVSFLALSYLLYAKRSRLVFAWGVLIICTYLSITARRNVPLFYIMSMYILFAELKIQLNQVTHVVKPLGIAVLATILIFFLDQPTKTFSFNKGSADYCESLLVKLPCDLVKRYKNLTGNVFAMYEWGGYLIWKLPSTKVFVDGRMPAWRAPNNESPYTTFLKIIQTQNGWNEQLVKYKTDYLLIQEGTFLDLKLQETKLEKYGWKELYRDKLAVLYKKL